MTDLFTTRPPVVDKPAPGQNLPEFSVSELAGGIKRALENTFEHVRVRGEVSKPLYHSSGHLYFSLKDADAVIDATCWKARVGRLPFRLEDGMDVVVTGQVTSYAKSSKYQISVESVALAGEGALLKLLQERKERLQKEGLFDTARKKALPKYPTTIGVITSPTGAVIRDILHRLSDRYPVRVLLWPVAVQGDNAAEQVACAITGMNALTTDKPDIIIVARGGGSLEDLMAFNEEVVVRAAATSAIPLISAVGHETDTTLIDFAADVRAPTPTAAAELATPVRRDLVQQVAQLQQRATRMLASRAEHAGLLLAKYASAIQKPERFVQPKAQNLDALTDKLARAGKQSLQLRAQKIAALHLLHPKQLLVQAQLRVQHSSKGLQYIHTLVERAALRLEHSGKLLASSSYENILGKGFALVRGHDGHVVTKAASLPKGRDITLTFSDGSKDATVK